MAVLVTLTNWLLPLLYLGLLIDYGTTFFLRTRTASRNPLLPVVLVVHALFLVLRSIHEGRPPMVHGHEILSILALSTAAVYLVLEIAVRDRRAGVFIVLLVFLFQYTSSVFVGDHTGAQSGWARAHIIPAIIAYTAFAVGAIHGILHLLAHRNLKRHSVGVLFDRLPPVELLGKMSWCALVVGFIFMTVNVATGPLLLKYVNAADPGAAQAAWHVEPRVALKIIAGCTAWIIYGLAIAGRSFARWPMERISGIGVLGFAITMIMIVGSAFLP